MRNGKRRRTDSNEGGSDGNAKKTKPELVSTGEGSHAPTFTALPSYPHGDYSGFLHHVPGGYNAGAQMMSLPPPPTSKTRMCNDFTIAGCCNRGDRCRFAHFEPEILRSYPNTMPPLSGRAASFGVSSSAKISVDASLVGSIIGKAGQKLNNIRRLSGADLHFGNHESDPNLRNFELEGSFEQIVNAASMVRYLLSNLNLVPAPARTVGASSSQVHHGSNKKKVLAFANPCGFKRYEQSNVHKIFELLIGF